MLPLEILFDIFSFLALDREYSTLARCATLCRSTRYACQKPLFNDLAFVLPSSNRYALRLVDILSSNENLLKIIHSISLTIDIPSEGYEERIAPALRLFDSLALCQIADLALRLFPTGFGLPAEIPPSLGLAVHTLITSLRPTLRALRVGNLPMPLRLLHLESLNVLDIDQTASWSAEDLHLIQEQAGVGAAPVAPLKVKHLCLSGTFPNDLLTSTGTEGTPIDYQSISSLSIFITHRKPSTGHAALLQRTNNLKNLFITAVNVDLNNLLYHLHPNALVTLKKLEADVAVIGPPRSDFFIGLFEGLNRFSGTSVLESLIAKSTIYSPFDPPGSWPFCREDWEKPMAVLKPKIFAHLKEIIIKIHIHDDGEPGGGMVLVDKLRESSFTPLRALFPDFQCLVTYWREGMVDAEGKTLCNRFVIH